MSKWLSFIALACIFVHVGCTDNTSSNTSAPVITEPQVVDPSIPATAIPERDETYDSDSVLSNIRPNESLQAYVQNEDTVYFSGYEKASRLMSVKTKAGLLATLTYKEEEPVLPKIGEPILIKWHMDSVGYRGNHNIYRERLSCYWQMPLQYDEATQARLLPITGRWAGKNSFIEMSVGMQSMAYLFHGQCVYFFPVKKEGDALLWIWQRDMDCVFDVHISESFGLAKHPKIGLPFARLSSVDSNNLRVEYLYPEWMKAYARKVEPEAFPETFTRKKDDE